MVKKNFTKQYLKFSSRIKIISNIFWLIRNLVIIFCDGWFSIFSDFCWLSLLKVPDNLILNNYFRQTTHHLLGILDLDHIKRYKNNLCFCAFLDFTFFYYNVVLNLLLDLVRLINTRHFTEIIFNLIVNGFKLGSEYMK